METITYKPYDILETDEGFFVRNTETGKRKNAEPYKSRADAVKYQRALYAAENQTTKAETYKVPEAARNNARKVLAWREKYGTEVKGMTEVGWRRARQLADNAEVGLETVKRMAQFARHRKNSEVAPEYKSEPWKDAGYVAWLGWGGTSGIEWAGEISGREKEHDGVVLALMLPPSIAEMVAVNGMELPPGVEALPPYEMHVTLCYLGDALQVDNQKLNILKAVSDYAQMYPAITGRLNGYGRFVETHIEDTEALYLNFDSPALTTFRAGLYEMLRGLVPLEENHGYTPHVTLAYVPKGTELKLETPLPIEMTIDAVTVRWGEEWYTFALGGAFKESRLKELFTGLLDFFGFKKKESPVENHNDLTVFKDASGAYRWVLISSNAYRDRDGEIVSQKALQADVDRADADGDFGPLRWWHVPGLDIGDTDFNMLNGKFLIESGTFHNPEIAEAVKADADNLQGSIGFRHPANEPNANGEFETIRRFERSLVPRGRASNPFTSLTVKEREYSLEGEDMTTLKEKYQAFRALLKDEELANDILRQAESKEKELDAAGVAFKEVTDTTPDPETLTPKKETAGVQPDSVDTSHKADEAGDPDEGEKPDEMGAMHTMMTEMKAMMEELKGMYSKAKDDTAALRQTQEARQQEQAVAFKAYQDKLAALEGQQTATIEALAKSQKEIRELMGDLPKNISGYLASAAEDTVVKEGDERFKDAEPHADPLADFSKNFVFKGTPFATQTN